MGYPNKGSSYPDLKNDTSIAKTDGDKLKLLAEQLKSASATKMTHLDKHLMALTSLGVYYSLNQLLSQPALDF